MFLSSNQQESSSPTPAWASFFTADEYNQFIKTLGNYWDQSNIAYTLKDSVITTDELGSVNFIACAHACKQHPYSEWENIITNYFNYRKQAYEFEAQFFQKVHDFSYVEPYIGVHLFHKDFLSQLSDDMRICKSVANDLVAILIFNLPYGMKLVEPVETIQWNKTNEELYEIGLANIRKKYVDNITRRDFDEHKVWFIDGDHPFVSNKMLELHLHPELIGTYGSLVSIPYINGMIVYPIEDKKMLDMIEPFIFITRNMYELNKDVQPISESIYWYHNQAIIHLPYTVIADSMKINFTPPKEFNDMVVKFIQADK